MNSLHYPSVDRVGQDLVATTRASDGVVEGLELPGELLTACGEQRTTANPWPAARAVPRRTAGHAGSWKVGQFGAGRSYIFTGPYGHMMQLLWDVEKYKAAGEFASQYPDRPEKRSSHGVAPCPLDHRYTSASRSSRSRSADATRRTRPALAGVTSVVD